MFRANMFFVQTVLVVLAMAIISVHVNAAPTFELCAEAWAENEHLLVVVNKKSQPVTEYVPVGNFYVTIAEDFSFVNLEGTLKKRAGANQDKLLEMDYTFTENSKIDECFCASEDFTNEFGGTPTFPNYDATQTHCTRQNVNDATLNPDDLLFCPHCEDDQCKKAKQQGFAPDPIWEDWEFFGDALGTLSGEGMQIFRNKIKSVFPVIDASILACTPSIRNLPLAQMYCTNWTDPSPPARGFGVNSKNQRCGFAVWFNCQEDLEVLDENSMNPNGFSGHAADINLRLVPCPGTRPPTPPELCPEFPPPPDQFLECCGFTCYDTERQTCLDLYNEMDDEGCVVSFGP